MGIFNTLNRVSSYISRVRIPSGPQRVTSYPQSNLLALSEKLTERQLRLTGGEHFMVTKKFQTSELQQIDLLTIQEVADWAKVSTKTVYRWISDNKIPAIRLGNRTYRIPEKAIIDYLKKSVTNIFLHSLLLNEA